MGKRRAALMKSFSKYTGILKDDEYHDYHKLVIELFPCARQKKQIQSC